MSLLLYYQALLAATSQPTIAYAQEYLAAWQAAGGVLTAAREKMAHDFEADLLALTLLDPYDRAACRLPAWWPMMGGTAATHALNFVNPAAYLLQFYNSPLHDNDGVHWNGINQYAETGFSGGANFTGSTGGALHYYSRSDDPGSNRYEMGIYEGNSFVLSIEGGGGAVTGVAYGAPGATSSASGKGMFSVVRQPDTVGSGGQLIQGQTVLMRNGAVLDVQTQSGQAPTGTVWLGALHFPAQNGYYNPSARPCSGAGFSLGLSMSEAVGFQAACQKANTTLGRAV